MVDVTKIPGYIWGTLVTVVSGIAGALYGTWRRSKKNEQEIEDVKDEIGMVDGEKSIMEELEEMEERREEKLDERLEEIEERRRRENKRTNNRVDNTYYVVFEIAEQMGIDPDEVIDKRTPTFGTGEDDDSD